MTREIKPEEIWIGLAEVRPLKGCNLLDDAKGAFVNVVLWAVDADGCKRRVESMVAELHLFLVDITRSEPIATRRQREGDFEKEIEDMILRSQDNPNDVIFGTFHLWEKDDA